MMAYANFVASGARVVLPHRCAFPCTICKGRDYTFCHVFSWKCSLPFYFFVCTSMYILDFPVINSSYGCSTFLLRFVFCIISLVLGYTSCWLEFHKHRITASTELCFVDSCVQSDLMC